MSPSLPEKSGHAFPACSGNPLHSCHLPTPSPTPLRSFPEVDPSTSPSLQSGAQEGPADRTREEQMGGIRSSGVKRRKKRRREGLQTGAPGPAELRICVRGGTRVVKRSRQEDQPQESHYQSDEEVHAEEPCEQLFSPGRMTASAAPEIQRLPERASHFVLALVLACRDVVANENSPASCSVFQLLQSLKGLASRQPQPSEDSLEDLALRCIRAEELVSSLDFVYMVNCIQLRCKLVK